jgi:small subunit ribosomal protein S3
MGYIGVRIRIAKKDRFIPEFELKGVKDERTLEQKQKDEADAAALLQAKTESEAVKIIAEKIENLDLMEDVEEKLK